ncbi:G kinase-anchoring protein 1 [Bicyclus anynana]|uniref:G kinase-anchoring protein 1 n=1 Tax=Bicyclus anynana TaxID=110368 RepID=A0A6J1NXH3_BICAN|nr:G kinase-anchoring protein 1 [Bicyclus anynana]XP_023949448.2 G kinase-anchoring protein 1 [Bicyclus anynana]XP_052742623.1 G kinase-anchoring protein 1 [Bicyclus anynana]
MAALVVQSRFAGLKIEDDDHTANENQKSKKTKGNPIKKLDSAKKPKSSNKSQPLTKKRKQKPVEATSEQWEMWKQKDEEIVVGNFESQMQEAILLSKLDYEEKKDVYKQIKRDAEIEKKIEEQSRAGSKKQKKKHVMSLEQFNDLVTHGEEPNFIDVTSVKNPEEELKQPDKDTTFFDRIQTETKNELLKDKIIDRVLNQTVPDEVITRLQFTETLEKKDKEISALKQQVMSLKDELLTVKSRNKKLCNILGQGEMKDKAEILVEVERLRCMQSEMTSELASLHQDLEKERSRNADPRAKDKRYGTKKKNIRFDVSSEAILSKDTSSGTS